MEQETKYPSDRSERAQILIQEGRFGGPQPGSGRPRKRRAAEIVAEQVADEAQALFDRLMEIARSGTDSNAITAIRELMSIEDREAVRKEREEARIEDMHRDQLLAYVASQIMELSDRGIIPSFGVIDGQAVEVEDSGPSGTRQITSGTEED